MLPFKKNAILSNPESCVSTRPLKVKLISVSSGPTVMFAVAVPVCVILHVPPGQFSESATSNLTHKLLGDIFQLPDSHPGTPAVFLVVVHTKPKTGKGFEVEVGVGVLVNVGVTVLVGVLVNVGVIVGVLVNVGVIVGVGVGLGHKPKIELLNIKEHGGLKVVNHSDTPGIVIGTGPELIKY